MNTNDVIESYVTDVALQLPRKQRNDVAFELRALIAEGLQDKADAAGRAADAGMATDFLRAFGRPEDVAARYRPTLTIIDPADGPGFLRTSVIGLVIIWCLGLVQELGQPIGSGWDLLQVVGRWWTGTVIASLWWPGVLVTGYGIAAWTRRRRPQANTWKPRAADRIHGGRAAKVMALVGIACALFVLFDPRWILDFFWGGHAAPAAYNALTYTDTFLHRQGPWLFGLLLLNVPVFLVVIVSGRWSTTMRRVETVLGLAVCAVVAWTVLDGPVFVAANSDRTAKVLLGLVVVFSLAAVVIELRQRIKPTPGQHGQVQR